MGILLGRDARGAASGRHRLLLASGSTVVVALSMAVVLSVAVVPSGPAQATTPVLPGPSRHDTSPVNLSTPIDMANGLPQPSAVVRSGGARIEVLTPTLLRLEYSPSGTYENRPTVNAINRRMAVPRYTAQVSHGWLTVQTSRATLRYKVGSGPFTEANTSLRLAVGGRMSTVHPTWEWECPFGQTCQAGAAVLGGGASLSQSQGGYQSTAGYAGYLNRQGAGATWSVLGAPSGPAAVSIRCPEPAIPPVADRAGGRSSSPGTVA